MKGEDEDKEEERKGKEEGVKISITRAWRKRTKHEEDGEDQ